MGCDDSIPRRGAVLRRAPDGRRVVDTQYPSAHPPPNISLTPYAAHCKGGLADAVARSCERHSQAQ
jgi:hypothetical protein